MEEDNKEKEIQSELNKTYELMLNKDIYLLNIKIYTNEKICFNLNIKNKKYFIKYKNEYKYDEIIKLLLLQNELYENLYKIFKYFDTQFSQNKIILLKNNNNMRLLINKENEEKNNEKECYIDLLEEKISYEEIIDELYKKIDEITIKNNNNEKLIKELIKEKSLIKQENSLIQKYIDNLFEANRNMESMMNLLIKDNKELKSSLEELLINSGNNQKYPKPNIGKDIPVENLMKLKMNTILTNNNNSTGMFANFTVFIGLYDKIEYLVFVILNEYNSSRIKVMRIKDKRIIISLNGHSFRVNVLRYYIKNNRNDYILSCDQNETVIIWDIQDKFNIKYVYQERNYSGIIYDSLILFNINNIDYIYLSNDNDKGEEPSKLYELQKNVKLIKHIYNTEKNCTYFNIPWYYKDKYYVIECCKNRISINNIFEERCYANVHLEDENTNYCGYIYNKIFLCVSSRVKGFNVIVVWNLTNMIMDQRFDLRNNSYIGREIIPWNNKYAILGGKGCILIYNLEKENLYGVINLAQCDNTMIGIKKIKLEDLGECLICSDDKNNILLFNI